MAVGITGANMGQQINVQYSMNVEVDGDIINSVNHNGIVTCSPAGTWSQPANGNGNVAGTTTRGTGGHQVVGFSDIFDQANPSNSSTKSDDNDFVIFSE
jgi:hypothetical protein